MTLTSAIPLRELAKKPDGLGKVGGAVALVHAPRLGQARSRRRLMRVVTRNPRP